MTYAALACNQTGLGYVTDMVTATSDTVTVANASTLFPVLQDGQFFYAFLRNSCGTKCEQVKVTATNGNVFTVSRTGNDCFGVASTLTYDGMSPQAINAIVTGRIVEASSPLVYNAATGGLSLDETALETALKALVLSADSPLQFDNESGVISLDTDALLATFKPTILGWITGTDPVDVSEGAISLDIATLKTALGLDTTT